jgi:hypothetical protein
MDAAAQNRYLSVRSRLAELSYGGCTFGADSVDLVEKLLDDVVSTTTAYKQVQEREARLSSDLTLAQGQLFPLHKENTRLARENHALHVESIRLKDGLEVKLEEGRRKVKDLEAQLKELTFLSNGKDKQLRAVEKEKERLRAAFEASADPERKASARVLKGNVQMSSALPPPPAAVGVSGPEEGSEGRGQVQAQVKADAQLIEGAC